MKSIKPLLAPALLVVGGVVVLQYHSMQFWSEHTDVNIGWLWSLLIELAGLWLWFQTDTAARVLGALASVVLLAAPLYFLGSHALADYEQAKQEQAALMASQAAARAAKQQNEQDRQARIDTLQASIAKHHATIKTYLENSKSRAGWSVAIADVQQRLDADKAALLGLLGSNVTLLQQDVTKVQQNVTNVTGLFITVFLQCAGLVIIQLANIKAMIFMANVTKVQQHVTNVTAETDVKPVVHNTVQVHVEQAVHQSKDDIEVLQERVVNHLKQARMTAADFAEQANVARAQVSFLINYAAGGRKPSKAAVAAMAEVV